MRANEFINEGWYDDAKAKVKSATTAASQSLGNIKAAGNSRIAKLGRSAKNGARQIRQGVSNAVSDFQQTNAAHAAAHSPTDANGQLVNPIQAPQTSVSNTIQGAAQTAKQAVGQARQAVAPALSGMSKMASAVRQGVAGYKQSGIDRQADKIFISQFNKQIDAEMMNARRSGVQFSMPDFIRAYMTKYHWKAGNLEQQLMKAVNANDRYQIPQIMAKIGKMNTNMMGTRSIMQPTPPAPPPPPAPAAPSNPFRGV